MTWRMKVVHLGLLCSAEALLLFGVSSAQAPQTSSQPQSLDRALQFARAHRYAEAEAAIKGIPPPAEREQRISFFRLKAAIAEGLGNANAAAEDMEAAAKLAPKDVNLQLGSGIARLQAQVKSHENPSATLRSLRSVGLPPASELDLRLRMAEILTRANLYAEAVVDFEAASRLGPSRSDILYNLALARFHTSQWDAALESAERVKALEDSASLESLIGDIQEKRGDALAAVHSYQAAVALEPGEERHRLALGVEFLRHQTFDAALLVFEQSAALFPQSVRVKILLGLTYYLVDRSPDAIRSLLEASQLDPKDEIAARYLGEITLQDTATPNSAAVTQLCGFADEQQNFKNANVFCGGALLRVARDTEDYARKPEILRRLQQAERAAPGEPTAHCELGKAFEWTEQWQEARTQTEACVRLQPDSSEGHYRLSRIYRRLGLKILAKQQTLLQQQAVQRQSEESVRRANTVTKFLFLLEHQ